MFDIAIRKYLHKHGFRTFCPKVVLFDMDGVLYNSMPNHAIAWQKAMRSFGLDMTEHDAYATEGQRGIDTIRIMAKEQLDKDITEQQAQEMYDEKARIFGLLPEAPVMEGAKELMQQIKNSGLQIGIVTGSGQRPLIERLQRDFGNFVDTEHIVTAYDVKRGKPAPDPYIMGLKKAGNMKPWEGIVVENAPLGVCAGSSARIFTVGVNTGPLPDCDLWQQGADMVFSSMAELDKKWGRLPQSQYNQV